MSRLKAITITRQTQSEIKNRQIIERNRNDINVSLDRFPIFPNTVNGEIGTEEFLEATRQAVKILDYFGLIFISIKQDMIKNIEKIAKKHSISRENYSTLQKLLIDDKNQDGHPQIIESLLWLKRELHMIQILFDIFSRTPDRLKSGDNMCGALTASYQLTLEPFHGYTNRHLFYVIVKYAPKQSEVFQSLARDYGIEENLLAKNMERFSISLKSNIVRIQRFYLLNNLLSFEKSS